MLYVISFCVIMLLTACGTTNTSKEKKQEKEEQQDTYTYETITGEKVEMPKNPQRVVMIGSTLGDFLVLDIPIVGSNLENAATQFYDGKTEDIKDVGNPGDLEVILDLKPDLIVNSFYKANEEQHAALSKIALTVPFNPALPYQERLAEMGKMFDKEKEVEKWLVNFEEKTTAMWDEIDLEEGQTATIFLQSGKALYVMGKRSLGAVLYDEEGFEVPHAIQKNIIDEDLTFAEISEELLAEYAGDHLFVLTLNTDESKEEISQLLDSATWETLPAVQEGKVYQASAEWNSDNLLTLTEVLTALPKWMN